MTGKNAEREKYESIMGASPKTFLQNPGKKYIEAGTTW